MSIKVILFDLDGTLLPMEQEVFIKQYFGLLAKKLAPHGYEPNKLIESILLGTKAMIKNIGATTNEEVFWSKFSEIYGEAVKNDMPKFDDFYHNEFAGVKDVCGFNPEVANIVKTIKQKGYRLALATNPIFPAIATENRIKWAGLKPEYFELYTTYENSKYSKPNPKYYMSIAEKLNVKPEECLMVGNDILEDMVAKEIGMQVFLLTDCLINKENIDFSIYPNGTFADLLNFIDNN